MSRAKADRAPPRRPHGGAHRTRAGDGVRGDAAGRGASRVHGPAGPVPCVHQGNACPSRCALHRGGDEAAVPAGRTPADGGELGQPGEADTDRRKGQCPAPAQMARGADKEDEQERDHVGARQNGAPQQSQATQTRRFQRIMRSRRLAFMLRTTVGSYPQCIMQCSQRGSRPEAKRSQSVRAMSSA